MYIYIYMHNYIYIFTFTYLDIYKYVFVYLYKNIFTYIYMIFIYLYLYLNLYLYTLFCSISASNISQGFWKLSKLWFCNDVCREKTTLPRNRLDAFTWKEPLRFLDSQSQQWNVQLTFWRGNQSPRASLCWFHDRTFTRWCHRTWCRREDG